MSVYVRNTLRCQLVKVFFTKNEWTKNNLERSQDGLHIYQTLYYRESKYEFHGLNQYTRLIEWIISIGLSQYQNSCTRTIREFGLCIDFSSFQSSNSGMKSYHRMRIFGVRSTCGPTMIQAFRNSVFVKRPNDSHVFHSTNKQIKKNPHCVCFLILIKFKVVEPRLYEVLYGVFLRTLVWYPSPQSIQYLNLFY